MRLLIIAVGRLKDGPERALVDRYAARLRSGVRTLGISGFDILEIPESRARDEATRKREEAAALQARIPTDATVLLLDERGHPDTSRQFAGRLERARARGAAAVACVVGGPDGLDPAWKAERVAFGRLTLPHQVVRALAAEQLYRATTILAGHPYHRD